MTSTILYFTFLSNYIYLILILWHSKKEYKVYLLNLILASVLGIFCIAYHRNSLSFFLLNFFIFFFLLICPIWLTKKISNALGISQITAKILLYAKWRYWITHSPLHYSEYLELIEAAPYYNSIVSIEKSQKIKKKFWKEYPATTALIVANIFFFILLQIYKQEQGFLAFLNFGVNSFEFVFYQKEYWRLFSSMFLHFDFLHLGMNLFGLYLLSPLVEKAYGKGTFFLIYFICGFFSSIASIFWRSYQMTLSMGASGAICGLMGAYFFLFQKKEISIQWKKHQIFSFWFTIAAFAVIGYFIPQMDNAAHFCGLFSGVFLSFVFKKEKIIFKKILFFLCIVGILWSIFSQILYMISFSYPSCLKEFSWYRVYDQKNSILIPLPFSWKPNFALNQKKFSLYKKEKPFSMPIPYSHFWDVYQLGHQGELFVKISLLPFSHRVILKMGLDDISYKKKRKKDFLLKPSLEKIGSKEYYHFKEKFGLNTGGEKVEMISSCYFFSHKSSLYQWKFQYPKKQRKQYDFLIKKILEQVDCF